MNSDDGSLVTQKKKYERIDARVHLSPEVDEQTLNELLIRLLASFLIKFYSKKKRNKNSILLLYEA